MLIFQDFRDMLHKAADRVSFMLVMLLVIFLGFVSHRIAFGQELVLECVLEHYSQSFDLLVVVRLRAPVSDPRLEHRVLLPRLWLSGDRIIAPVDYLQVGLHLPRELQVVDYLLRVGGELLAQMPLQLVKVVVQQVLDVGLVEEHERPAGFVHVHDLFLADTPLNR